MGTLVQITLVSIVKVLRVWKLLNHIMHEYNLLPWEHLFSIANVSSQLLNHISRSSYVAKTTVKTLCEGNAAHSDYGTRGKAHPNNNKK